MGETFALFHVAAGARLGYGHLRRATTIASVLARPAALHLRGSADTPAGVQRVEGAPARLLDALRPRVVVIDDPHVDSASAWVRAARCRAVPAVSLHDLGLAPVQSDLAIDGSVATRRRWPAARVLLGPEFAVAGSGVVARGTRPARGVRAIAVSLGGGRHAASLRAIASALRGAFPSARILVIAGLHPGREMILPVGVEHVVARDGLRHVLRSVDLAVLGGGTSLYEAASLGVPTVAVPMVPAQQRTVRAFDRAGVAIAAGRFHVEPKVRARQVTRAVRTLALDASRRRRMARRGPLLVDGRGAERVADAIRALVETCDD